MDSIDKQIRSEETLKLQIDKERKALEDRLHRLMESLEQKYNLRSDFQRMLEDAEAAYSKIIESSSALLQVLQKESNSLLSIHDVE